MSFSSNGIGRVTATLVDMIRVPRMWPHIPAKALVVYLHSAASNATEAVGVGILPAVEAKLAAIADAGYCVVAPTQPITFGNGAVADTGASGTCQGRLTDAIAYGRATLGASNAPVVLVGSSMGSTTALRRAGLDPSNVACVVTFLTVGCLKVVVDNDIEGLASAVNTAYGGSVAQDGVEDPSSMVDTVPKLLTHGSTDDYSTTSGHLISSEYGSGRGATIVAVNGMDHENGALSGVSTSTVVDFIRSHT